MLTPPRLGVVLCGLQLLLLVTGSAGHRLSSAADHRQPSAGHRPLSVATAHRPPPVTDHRPLPTATAHRPLASGTNSTSRQESSVRDCSDLAYGSASGVYMILEDLQTPQPVYCDMSDGEGWTVFQRRADITPRRNFLLDWESYKWGLGRLDQEFWWGLHFLWQLTSKLDRIYELRVDLWDWENQTRYATYQDFTIASEADGYQLHFTDYYGTAGDSLGAHKGMKFTTIDRDNDESLSGNCASMCTGAWWYRNCRHSNLNGLYSPGTSDWGTVSWVTWKGDDCLNATTMKIRPTMKL